MTNPVALDAPEEPMNEYPNRKPHEVGTPEAAYYICGECGERVEWDGDYAFHEDPALNPGDES